MSSIKVIQLVKTCDVSPSQWDGITDDRRRVFIHFRLGRLIVRVGEPDDMRKFAAVNGEQIFRHQLSGKTRESMPYEILRMAPASKLALPATEL